MMTVSLSLPRKYKLRPAMQSRIRNVQIRAIENLTLEQVESRVRVLVQIRTPHVSVEIRRQVWDQALRKYGNMFNAPGMFSR